jgi:hypothetical protein
MSSKIEPIQHDGWAIDHSAGRPILVYKKCSVIESDDAYYILDLVRKDQEKAAPAVEHACPVQLDGCDGSCAPVVERQLPNGAIENGRAFMERVEQLYNFTDEHGHQLANCSDWQEFVKCFEYLVEHTAPPELAELQATIAEQRQLLATRVEASRLDEANETIARLMAENERLKSESFESLYNESIDEIERLKGGQGEAVAWGNTSDLAAIAGGALWSGTLWGVKNHPIYEARIPLYTSQPAPVSVVRCSFCDVTGESGNPWSCQHETVDGVLIYRVIGCKDHKHLVDACLDKVKEMNQ